MHYLSVKFGFPEIQKSVFNNIYHVRGYILLNAKYTNPQLSQFPRYKQSWISEFWSFFKVFFWFFKTYLQICDEWRYILNCLDVAYMVIIMVTCKLKWDIDCGTHNLLGSQNHERYSSFADLQTFAYYLDIVCVCL